MFLGSQWYHCATDTIGGNVGTNDTLGSPNGTIGKPNCVNSNIRFNTPILFLLSYFCMCIFQYFYYLLISS